MEGEKEGHTDINIIKVVAVEFNISMHCDACERIVAKTISKIKGVEQFVTDMINHKVKVVGRFKPEKVMKKLKKKTGKRVEMLSNNHDAAAKDAKGEEEEESATFGGYSGDITKSVVLGYYGDSCVYTMMFSDENANACSIM